MLRLLLFLLPLWHFPLLANDDSQKEDLREAQRLYEQGEFAAVSKIYERFWQATGVNASVLHNLGVSLYREGDHGAAVAAFLTAAQLRPQDPDIRFNLQFLLAKNEDRLDVPDRTPIWAQPLLGLRAWGERTIFWGLCASLFFYGVFLAISIVRGKTGRWLLSGTIVSCLCMAWLALHVFASAFWRYQLGAVTSASAAVYTSPTEHKAVVIFQLRRGAPFAILETSGAWLKIQLADGKSGWILGQQTRHFAHGTWADLVW